MVKRMCMDAGIEHDQKSNHSLRATGATAMFQSNVPETVIQKTTGHRSLQALCTYEPTSAAQHQDVSKVLMSARKDLQSEPQVASSSLESVDPCKMLGGFVNCTIGSLTVNMNSTFTTNNMSTEEEFDKIVADYNV